MYEAETDTVNNERDNGKRMMKQKKEGETKLNYEELEKDVCIREDKGKRLAKEKWGKEEAENVEVKDKRKERRKVKD